MSEDRLKTEGTENDEEDVALESADIVQEDELENKPTPSPLPRKIEKKKEDEPVLDGQPSPELTKKNTFYKKLAKALAYINEGINGSGFTLGYGIYNLFKLGKDTRNAKIAAKRDKESVKPVLGGNGEHVGVSPVEKDNNSELIKSAEFTGVKMRDGEPAAYLDISTMKPEEVKAMQAALEAKEIKSFEKESSLGRVLAVSDPESMNRLSELNSSAPSYNSLKKTIDVEGPAQAGNNIGLNTKPTPADEAVAKINNTLKAGEVQPKGMQVEKPSGRMSKYMPTAQEAKVKETYKLQQRGMRVDKKHEETVKLAARVGISAPKMGSPSGRAA